MLAVTLEGLYMYCTTHIQGGVKKILVALCHKTGDKCWPNGTLCLNADFQCNKGTQSCFPLQGKFPAFLTVSYILKNEYCHCLTSDAKIIWYHKTGYHSNNMTYSKHLP